MKSETQPARLQYLWRALLFGGILLSFLPAIGIAQPVPASRKVLVLYWYNKDYSWNVAFDQSFKDVLRSDKSLNVDYYAEYLETDRFPEGEQSAALHDYLQRKYRDHQIDLIVATSDASLDFLLRYRKDLFPDSPIIFVATQRPGSQLLASHPVTGILNVNTYKPTLDLALRFHPNTEQVFMISGTVQRDRRLETLAREELTAYEEKLKITYLTDRMPTDLVAITRSLPRRSIVIFVWQQYQNEQGQVMEAPDILAAFAPSTPVPIYGMSNPTIGLGVIGGYINTAAAIGKRAAEMALQLAHGTPIQSIPVENAPSVPIFDWRELVRWGIDADQLPSDRILRFQTFSLLEQHKGIVIGGLALILLLSALVGLLLLERSKRQRSEQSRLQLATVVESSEDAIITLDLDGKILTWNTGAELMYGYTAQEVLGRHISIIVPPDHKEVLDQNLERLAKNDRVENFETVRMRKDGTSINVSIGVSFIRDAKGRIIKSASITRDISQLKKAEEALRESEQELQRLTVRLLNLQDTERRRLARELHDVTAQNVFATSLNLSRLERSQLDPAEQRRLLAESRQLCDQALQEIRTLSYLLHPPVLDQAGLVGALKWYVEGFARRSGIEVDISSIKDVGRLDTDVETALFRVVQESLTNTSRHSGSSTAVIKLERQGDQVILQITDHGRGMSKLASSDTEGAASLGVGIPGMRQRLRQFGGILQIASNDRGTVVTASVPSRSAANDDSHLVGRRSQASA